MKSYRFLNVNRMGTMGEFWARMIESMNAKYCFYAWVRGVYRSRQRRDRTVEVLVRKVLSSARVPRRLRAVLKYLSSWRVLTSRSTRFATSYARELRGLHAASEHF